MSEMTQTTFDYGSPEKSDGKGSPMSEMVQATFDYGALDEETRVFVKGKAEAIHARFKRAAEDIIAIGQDLREVQEKLSRYYGGEFVAWLRAEFEMSYRTGYRFIQVAERFAEGFDKLSKLSVSVLYALAAPSTSDAVVEQVQSGEIEATLVSIKAAKEAEKRRADEAESAKQEVEQQLQGLREEVATLQRQLEEKPQVIEKSVENPETEAALARLREKYAEIEARLLQKTERVKALSEEIRLHESLNQQERYNAQVRYKFRQACDAFHLGINQGMTRMVTPLDAATAFEGDDWARLSEVLTSLKRGAEALKGLRESVSSQFVDSSVEP
jgi:uncharacterized protein YukE